MEESVRIRAEYGILQLAYIGDAVMELYVRERLLICNGQCPTGKLSRMAKAFVSCEAQSDAVGRIEADFTEEEASIFRRGRNAKTKHTPSHGDPIQYKRATGLEALFGYLFLTGRSARARELFEKAFPSDDTAAALFPSV